MNKEESGLPPENEGGAGSLLLETEVTSAYPYDGGSGEIDDPYIIATAEQLAKIPETGLNKNYRLKTHITITGTWKPIFGFGGTFDGKGRTITGLKIGSSTNPESDFSELGLFAELNSTALVKDLGVINAEIYSSVCHACIGCIAGRNGGTIINCYATGTIFNNGQSGYSGGIAGINYHSSTISDCVTNVKISVVDSLGNFSGGITGYNGCKIQNSFSRSKISGGIESRVGGFVGYNQGSITNCYTTGDVSGGGNAIVGAIIGINKGTVTNVYWNTDANQIVDGAPVKNKVAIGEYTLPSKLCSGLTSNVLRCQSAPVGGISYSDGPSTKTAAGNVAIIDALNGGRGAVVSDISVMFWQQDHFWDNDGYPFLALYK